jgi:hypothetical protein
MRKRVLRLFRAKSTSDSGKSSDAQGVDANDKPSEGASQAELLLHAASPTIEDERRCQEMGFASEDFAVKERASRIYEILNLTRVSVLEHESLTGREDRAQMNVIARLEPIPEKSTPLSMTTFSPFNWDATFGCSVPEENEEGISPPLSPTATLSTVLSPHMSSTETSSAFDLNRSSGSTSTFGSAPLYFEGAKFKDEDAMSSPLFSALNKLDEAFREDPNVSTPPTCISTENGNECEAAAKMEKAENPRIESYRLGYLLAQVGMPEERKKELSTSQEPSSLSEALPPPDLASAVGPPATGTSLKSVVQSIKKNAATEELATSSLARVAAEFAAVNDTSLDREALERGYLRRVSEVVRSKDGCRVKGVDAATRSRADTVKQAKRQLREIEGVLDAPFDVSGSAFVGFKWRDWSWLESKSTERGSDQQVTAVESALNEVSRIGNRGSGTIVNLFSFFKPRVDEYEDSEDGGDENSESEDTSSSESSRSIGRASTQSSGVDISIPSQARFTGSARKESSAVDESRSWESGRSGRSSISSERVEKNQSKASVASEDVRRSYSIRSDTTLDKQMSQPKGGARPLTPLGFLSFFRVVSKVKSSDSEIRPAENNMLPAIATQELRDEIGETDGKTMEAKQSLETTGQITGSPESMTEATLGKWPILTDPDSNRKAMSGSLAKPIKMSKPPLHPVRQLNHTSARTQQDESSVVDAEEKRRIVPIILASQAGDGSESIELCASFDHVADASKTVGVLVIHNGYDDAVTCEVKPRSEARSFISVDSRDDVDSRHSQSQSETNINDSTLEPKCREKRASPPEVKKSMSLNCHRTSSFTREVTRSESTEEVHTEQNMERCLQNEVTGSASPRTRSGDCEEEEGPSGSLVMETDATDTAGATDDVDLLGILVGSESRVLWRRQETGLNWEGVSDEDDSSQFSQCDIEEARAPSKSSVRSSRKANRHGDATSSHKRALSVPTSLLRGSEPYVTAD